MLCRHGSSMGNMYSSFAKPRQCGYDSVLIAQKNVSSSTGLGCLLKSKTRHVLDKVKMMFMFTDNLTPAYKEFYSLDKKTQTSRRGKSNANDLALSTCQNRRGSKAAEQKSWS